MARTQFSVVVRAIISLGLLAAATLIFLNRQAILDHIAVWRFSPSPAIAAITERTDLTEKGRFLFYASHPELLERAPFNEACRSTLTEHAAILGCYASGRIYLFNIENEALDGIKEVTAAHEMLHAAYERLSPTEKNRVDELLNKQQLGDEKERIDELMAEYAKTEPGQRLNELHSIIGTEVASLDPELEAYYSRYFSDRTSLVELAKRYQTVFEELESQQESLVAELKQLAESIDEDGERYRSQVSALSSDVSSFNRRASSGSMERDEYERERASLLARQSQLRSTYDSIQRRVDLYEAKRKELASINSQSEALNRSINSSLPTPTGVVGG